jgi:glycerol-3-phosphate acyltransferase PlsY
MCPCWIGLRGGKGVATSLGVVLVLAPWSTLAAVVVYGLTMVTSRLGSLGSLLAAVVFAIVQTVLMVSEGTWSERWSLAVFTLAVPMMIIYRHRGNISRILRGEESRWGQGPGGEQSEADSSDGGELNRDPDAP